MRVWQVSERIVWVVCLCLLANLVFLPVPSHAATAEAINVAADRTLHQFRSEFGDAPAVLRDARGLLVFPEIIQAGIGLGGAYGEGVLRVGGTTVGYYSLTTGSLGIQFGAQRKSVIVAFLADKALREFQAKARRDGYWKAGVDGSVVIVDVGGQASTNPAPNAPIVGYVFDQRGLMFNLSLQDAKFSRIER
jgi:lipid-binding SYLF domain-containing protein